MSLMQAAILYGREDVRIERIPTPPVGDGEVRIRIRAALTCSTDVKVYRRGYHARMLSPPCRFGHEFAGEIDCVGEGVKDWSLGERVVAANSAPCDHCFFCERNQPELCEDLLFINGGFAEYMTVPDRIVRKNLLRCPDHLDFKSAALTEPLACVVHGAEESEIRTGETVAIIGGGPIGLMFIAVAALRGAEVVSVQRSGKNRAAAIRMGAIRVFSSDSGNTEILQINHGKGPDKVIECAGIPEVWELAVSMVRKGGLVNFFGGCSAGATINLDTIRMHYDSLKLISTFHHTPESIRQALVLLAEKSIPSEVLITDSAPLSALPEVLTRLSRGSGEMKCSIQT